MRTIEQIIAIFPDTKAGDWSQHKNGGGWKQSTARIDDTAYLGPNTILSGDARVYGNAQVSGDARVYGNAWDKTPIQIITDSYTFQAVTHKLIAAGCEHHTIEDWRENITKIANSHNVTDESTIAEYLGYIEMIHNWQVSRFGVDKA